MTEIASGRGASDRQDRAQAALERLGCQKLDDREPLIVKAARKLLSQVGSEEIPCHVVAAHLTRKELKRHLPGRPLEQAQVLRLLHHFGQPCPSCWRTLRTLVGQEKAVCSPNPLVTALQLLTVPAGDRRPDPLGRLLEQAPRDPVSFGRLVLHSADSVGGDVTRALGTMRDACLFAALIALNLEHSHAAELLGWGLAYLAQAEGFAEWEELCREDLAYGWSYCLESHPSPELEAMLLLTEAQIWRRENLRDLAIVAMEDALEALEGFEPVDPQVEVLLEIAPTLASRDLSLPRVALTRARDLCSEGGDRIHPTLLLRVLHNLAKADTYYAVSLIARGEDPEPVLVAAEHILAEARPLYQKYDFEHLRLDRAKVRESLAKIRELGPELLERRGSAGAPDPPLITAEPRRSFLSEKPE